MVSKEEMKIVEKFQFFDKFGKLPDEKVRIDITLSRESLQKLEGMNRSNVVDNLVLTKL